MPLYPPSTLNIDGLALTDIALGDELAEYDVSATANKKITVERVLGLLNNTCQGRLTLTSGNPFYYPTNIATPSSTNTTNETITFSSAPGWPTGVAVKAHSTVGGLTANTTYYLNANSSTVFTVHTTIANAIAGTSKVNLTASITSELRPIGQGNTTCYFTPFRGNVVSLYDGTRWKLYTFSELSLSLSGFTASLPYDVFLYDNSGTLTLEGVAWTSALVRATALVLQDGVYVKSGDTTRRWVGTIATSGTGECEDTEEVRNVLSAQNRVRKPLFFCPGYNNNNTNTTYSLNSANWTELNGAAAVDLVTDGLSAYSVTLHIMSSATVLVGLGEDSTTSPFQSAQYGANEGGVCRTDRVPTAGAHVLHMLARNGGAANVFADIIKTGADRDTFTTYLSGNVEQ